MTLCELITKPITRMVEEENKNLDEIAIAVCPKIEYGREKIIRIIKDFLGEEYLIKHAETLKYDVSKANLAKKRNTQAHKKIDATTHSDSTKSADTSSHEKTSSCCQQSGENQEFNELVNEIKRLIAQFSLEDVKKALVIVESDA